MSEQREIQAIEAHGIWEHKGRTGFFFTGRDGSNRTREYVVTVCESGLVELAEMFRSHANYKAWEAERAVARAQALDQKLKGDTP